MTNNRLASISGILFAVLFTAGVVMVSSIPVGGGASSDAEIREFYDDSGDMSLVIVGLYLAAAAAIAFCLFLASLQRHWLPLDRDNSSPFFSAALISGIAFIAAAIVGSALLASLSVGIQLGDEPGDLPDTGGARFLGQAGYSCLLIGGGVLGGAFVGFVSLAALRDRRLPAWVAWLGIAVAVIVAVGSVIFTPLALLPLWILLVSVLLWRDGPAASVQGIA